MDRRRVAENLGACRCRPARLDRCRGAGPRSCSSAGELRSRSRCDPFAADDAPLGAAPDAGAGACGSPTGAAHDQFIQFTEGVLADEGLEPRRAGQCRARACSRGFGRPCRGVAAELLRRRRRERLRVGVLEDRRRDWRFDGRGHAAAARAGLGPALGGAPGRAGRAPLHAAGPDRAGRPARRRSAIHRSGLPARDAPAGRDPPGRLRAGAVAALEPRLRGLVQTEANGTRFDLAGERIRSRRGPPPGRCGLTLLCARTAGRAASPAVPDDRVPALLPEWGYGFWKSRDVYEHQDDVLEDFRGFRRTGIPLDAIVIDSPWETQYNTWKFNPHQFPDAGDDHGDARRRGADGRVGDAVDQRRFPRRPDPAAGRSPSACTASPRRITPPAPPGAISSASGARGSRRAVRRRSGGWGGIAGRLHQPGGGSGGGASRLGRCSSSGWRGSRPTTARATTSPIDVRLADGRTGAEAAWALGGLHRGCLQRALDEVHPGAGVLFGRSGWIGQHATGFTWGGDQASDFWSLRALVVATLTRGVQRHLELVPRRGRLPRPPARGARPPELLVRWLQFGCFTPLMHAHARMPQEPWHYSDRVLDLIARTCWCTSSWSPTSARRRRRRRAPGCRSSGRYA